MKDKPRSMSHPKRVDQNHVRSHSGKYSFYPPFQRDSYGLFDSATTGFPDESSKQSSLSQENSKYSYHHRLQDAWNSLDASRERYREKHQSLSTKDHQSVRSHGPYPSCKDEGHDTFSSKFKSSFSHSSKKRRDWYTSESREHSRSDRASSVTTRSPHHSPFNSGTSHSERSRYAYATEVKSLSKEDSTRAHLTSSLARSPSISKPGSRSPRKGSKQLSQSPRSGKRGQTKSEVSLETTHPMCSSVTGNNRLGDSPCKLVERVTGRNPSPPSHTFPRLQSQSQVQKKQLTSEPAQPLNDLSIFSKTSASISTVKSEDAQRSKRIDHIAGENKGSPSMRKASNGEKSAPLNGSTFFGREKSKSSVTSEQSPSKSHEKNGFASADYDESAGERPYVVRHESTPKSNGEKRPETPKNCTLRSVKKTDVHQRTSPRSPTVVTRRITTPTSSKTEEKRKKRRRSSPSKGEVKPKTLIKSGLRSAQKERKNSHEHNGVLRSSSPVKRVGNTESNRKLVQRTLETFFGFSTSGTAPSPQSVKKSTGLKDRRENKKQSLVTQPQVTMGNTTSVDKTVPTKEKGYVRRIYQEDAPQCNLKAVVKLTQLPEEELQSRVLAGESNRSEGKNSTTRMAAVLPTPSPSKKRSCEYPPPEPVQKVLKTTPVKNMPVSCTAQLPVDEGLKNRDEEDDAQIRKDEAARQAEADRRNKRRHSRGNKVFVYCDVLGEHIERHPVQNEIPDSKWSKWLNPTQLRCLVVAMLENADLCLKFSLDEKNEDWDIAWTKLASRLNTVCFNPLTQLNTGLRMTVMEWKKCWLELKTRLKKQIEDLKPEERVHNMGSLEILLYSKELYQDLMKSKGECLGPSCPRKWCRGACVGVFSPSLPVHRKGSSEC